jgi:hypothetical protein
MLFGRLTLRTIWFLPIHYETGTRGKLVNVCNLGNETNLGENEKAAMEEGSLD